MSKHKKCICFIEKSMKYSQISIEKSINSIKTPKD